MSRYLILLFFLICCLVPISVSAQTFSAGNLIKGSGSAVYYYGIDSQRHPFPNDKIFFSWFEDFSNVQTISDTELADISLGRSVIYKPGQLLKIQSDPKVYYVGLGGTLQWVTNETVATQLFGEQWADDVDDLSDAFFDHYKFGDPIRSISDADIFTATVNSPDLALFPQVFRPETSPMILTPSQNDVVTTLPRMVDVGWNYFSGADKYILQMDCDFCNPNNPVIKWSGTPDYFELDSSTISKSIELYGDNQFRFRVKAVNSYGVETPWSPFVYIRAQTPAQ